MVWAAVTGAAAILGLVAASTPMYLSSAGSEALERDLSGRCPASYAIHTRSSATPTEQERVLARFSQGRIGSPVLVAEGTLTTARFGGRTQSLKMMFLTGFEDHLAVIDGGNGAGLWIGERLAADLGGVRVGDTLAMGVGAEAFELRVAARTEDLFDRATDPFWCSIENLLEPTPTGDLPTPLVFVDLDGLSDDQLQQVFGVSRFGGNTLNQSWMLPVDVGGITASEARGVVSTISAINAALAAGSGSQALTDLDDIAARMEGLTGALQSSIRPLVGVVGLAGLGLLAVAAGFWVDRRRVELTNLVVRGAGPAAIGLKAGIEMMAPILVGVVAGWLLARPVVAVAGPSDVMETSAVTEGLRWALVAGLAAVGVVGAVAAVRSPSLAKVTETRRRRGGGWLWPAVVGAAAVWVRVGLGDEAVSIGENQLVGSVDPRVMLFPMLVFVAVGLAGAAVLLRVAPRLGTARAKVAGFLASRRIAAAPLLTTGLMLGAAIPAATLVYSAILTRSTTSTIDAKARSFVGADVSAPVYSFEVPDAISATATVVTRIERARIAGKTVDLMAIDPDTFPGGAFWDDSFAELPLDELMATLTIAGAGAGPTIPAIVANGVVGDGVVDAGGLELPIRVVASADAFPGARRDRPLIVIGRSALEEVRARTEGPTQGVRYLLWASGLTESQVEDALQHAGIGFAFTTAATATLDLLKFQSVVWTFDFLELYAGLGGVIAIGAILLYVDTRQRSRNLAYALARRMGLDRRHHLRAGLYETGWPVLTGVILGVASALLAAATLYRGLDPVPQSPPGPRWTPAWDITALATVVAGAVVWAAAHLSQRTADTADTADLLRHER